MNKINKLQAIKDFKKTRVISKHIDNLEIQNKLLVNTKDYANIFISRDKMVFVPITIFMLIASLVWPFTNLNIVNAMIIFVVIPIITATIYYVITNETRKKINKLNLKELEEALEDNETNILDLKEEFNRIVVKHNN